MAFAKPRFINEPSPKQAPDIPYKNEGGGNPVLSGLPLVVLSRIVSASSWLQQILWKMNKFDNLKELPVNQYNPRYDPTVIPIVQAAGESFRVSELPLPEKRKSEVNYYTCADYHNLYKSGAVTPTDIVEFLLPLIVRRGAKLNKHNLAFVETREDLVRAAAKASTERYKQGQPLSVLDGIPVAVKDEVDLEGYGRHLGSKLDYKSAENETSWCVRKWEEAGAIVIGKTNMHELGMDTCGNNPTFGTPVNPHNEGYYTGGSSSGSASAVAQGICPVALGCDGGGSIRLPSAFCGIWGLKPTHNRVSSRPTHNAAYSVAVSGPMCASVDDLALAFRIMAQPDPDEENQALFPHSLLKTATDDARSRRKIIGIDQTWVARSDPEVLKIFNDVVNYFKKTHGYETVDITIPLLPENQKALSLTILSEAMVGLTPQDIRQLSSPTQLLLNVVSAHGSAQHFLAAQRLRDCMMRHLAWLWEQHSDMIILTPTTPCAGWKIGHPSHVTSGYGLSDGDTTLRTMEYTYLANWTGAPAISCPLGVADENVPVGIMAMGEWGSEEQLLAFGKEAEGFLGSKGTRKPEEAGNWVDVLTDSRKT